ncbi:Geraniol 8-hydroxylase-like protein [Drosera capensis]
MDHLGSIFCILLAWFTVHILRAQLVSKKRRLPPGPFALPIIGNLCQLKYIFQVKSNSHRSFAILAKKYGPLMKLQFGKLTTVVISSTEVAREALQKNDISFSNRHLLDVMTAIDHHKDSVVWLPVSPHWRNLRKISNSQVFTRSRLDASRHLRHEKVDGLLFHVRMCSQKGDPVNIGQAAFVTSLNLLSSCFFSKDLAGYGTKEACDFKEIVWNIALEAETPNIVDVFPVLSSIDPNKSRYRMAGHFEKMKNAFVSMIDERLSSKVNGSPESNDVLDVLLKISESDGEELEREQIPHLLMDLFIAGTDTASRTLICAMAELLHNPMKLEKAQEELQQAIRKGNAVKEEDIGRLPYLQLIIKETLRLHPALPLLLPRKVQVDTQLCGYTVPKNAQVLVNAWAIGRDPRVWEKPDSFEPERFIGSEIDVKGQHFELIPFGAGRRICPGFPLVLRTLPLMLGSLIHEFNWELVNKTKLGSIEIDDFSTFFAHKPFLAIPIPK